MALNKWLRGHRVRAVTFSVTALTTLGLVFAVGGEQCHSDEDDPVAAVRAFAVLARTGDREAMYERLGPRTKSSLDKAAARASQLVNSNEYRGPDMIHVTPDDLDSPRYEMQSVSEDAAIVLAIDDSGRATSIELVRVDGRWHIELTRTP
jgi:hypothetical protein